jgi:hypothetical protein
MESGRAAQASLSRTLWLSALEAASWDPCLCTQHSGEPGGSEKGGGSVERVWRVWKEGGSAERRRGSKGVGKLAVSEGGSQELTAVGSSNWKDVTKWQIAAAALCSHGPHFGPWQQVACGRCSLLLTDAGGCTRWWM